MIRLPGLQVNVLDLLHEQHEQYTTELARVHQNLGKLYRKLAKIERDLSSRQELGLSRKEKKRLQWSRSESKQAVKKLEYSQASLHEYLRQCNNLIASYSIGPASPWGCTPTFYPPQPSSPTLLSAISMSFTPVHEAIPSFQGFCTSGGPQVWDLSMLPERDPSPGHGRSTDSGFYEPPPHASLLDQGTENNDHSQHVFAHEIVRQHESLATICNNVQLPSASEVQDEVPELPIPCAAEWTERATTGGATTENEESGTNSPGSSSKPTRRFSENAIQIIEARLSAAATSASPPVSPRTSKFKKVGHKRGISLGSAA